MIKLLFYDYIVYGSLWGIVEVILVDIFKDECRFEVELYYKVILCVDCDVLNDC